MLDLPKFTLDTNIPSLVFTTKRHSNSNHTAHKTHQIPLQICICHTKSLITKTFAWSRFVSRKSRKISPNQNCYYVPKVLEYFGKVRMWKKRDIFVSQVQEKKIHFWLVSVCCLNLRSETNEKSNCRNICLSDQYRKTLL